MNFLVGQRNLFRLGAIFLSFNIFAASLFRLEGAQGISGQNLTQGCQEEEIKQYINLLRDPDTQEVAGIELAESCGSLAVPSLAKFLQQEKDQAVREQILIVLDKIGGEKAIGVLIKTLSTDSNLKLRKIAAQKLGHLRAMLAVKPLVVALENLKEKSDVRQASASALGSIGGPTVVTPLVNAMKNIKNPLELRKSAVNALIKMKDLAIDSLAPILQDSNAGLQTQYWAIKILIQIDSQKSRQVLTSNQSRVIKILDGALKIPNNIVEFDRGLGTPSICAWYWTKNWWPRCR